MKSNIRPWLYGPEGIGQHLDAAGSWPDAPGFFEIMGKYGEVLVINGEVIETL